MKFLFCIFFLITSVCNLSTTFDLPARERRQVPAPPPPFAFNLNLTKPCDARYLMCPADVALPIDPATQKPVVTIPPALACTPSPVQTQPPTCADTTKKCCEVPPQPGAAAGPPAQQICVVPFGTKPGKCPARGNVGRVWNECVWDSNCSGKKKCCGGSLACAYYACVDPV